MHFLMGLNDTYNQVKSQILLMTPLPPMSRVFSLVLQEEKQRLLTAPSVPNLAFTASGSYKGQQHGHDKNQPLCTFCGRYGHTIQRCFKKHGYPPGLNNKAKPVHHISGESSSTDVDNASSSAPVEQVITQAQFQQFLSLLTSQMQQVSFSVDSHQPLDVKGQILSTSNSFYLDSSSWIIDYGETFYVCHD